MDDNKNNKTERTDAPLQSTDRRVRKTRTALMQALSKLLKQKSINSISVRELTDLADINRGTFYLHYRDVYDLLSQLEDDIIDEMMEAADHYSEEDIMTGKFSLFNELYGLCLKHADITKVLLSENGDIKFFNKLKSLMREKCLHDWNIKLKSRNPGHFDAAYAFVVGGCLNLIEYWYDSGMKESPDELAQITSTFLDHWLVME